MMPDQLWDTTMDPSKRTLKRVTVAHAEKCDALFATLMGSNVTVRKEFIVENSLDMKLGEIDL
jgi:DNA gyrase subunit B